MSSLSIEIEMVKQQITTKQNMINKASALKEYELCDKTQAEMRDLLKDKGKLERQLKEFQKKDTKSNWYNKLKESNSSHKVPLPPKNNQGMVDIRKLFKTTATSSTLASAAATVKKIPTSNETTAAVTVIEDVTDTEDKEATLIKYSAPTDLLEQDDYLKIITVEDRQPEQEDIACGVSDIEDSQQHDHLKIITVEDKQPESVDTCTLGMSGKVEMPTEEHSKFHENSGVAHSPVHQRFLL